MALAHTRAPALRASLNALEFVASYCAIDHAYTSISSLQCILSQTDRSTAGWLHKSSFHDAQPLQARIVRATATLLLEAQYVLYSQWIPGNVNDVSDCLSRDHHLTDAQLTALLYDSLPASQVHPLFSICPVPPALALQLT